MNGTEDFGWDVHRDIEPAVDRATFFQPLLCATSGRKFVLRF
jgi:hypothetical protein